MKKILALTLAIILSASVATFPAFAEEALFSLTASDEFIIEQETITEGVNYDGPDSPLNQFPFLEVIDGTIFASWSEHRDVVINDTADALIMSTDGGKTWTNKQKITNFYPTSINKLPDGTLYGMNYNTRFIDDYTMKVFYFTSDDGGLSWTENEGKVHFDKAITKNQGLWASFTMHRTLMVMDDGSIQGVIYGTYKGDAYYRCLWIKSTDNGKNYYVVSEIGSGVPVGADGTVYDDVEGFCEPVAARCLDGSLIAVMRIDSYKPLFYARSYDDGLTWTTPTTLAGIENMGHIWSVDPDLELTSDGTLLLSYGRHNIRVLVSLDGCGYDWQEPAALTLKGATGYSGIREVSPGKILIIGDRGLPEHTNTPTIWGNFLTLNRRTSESPVIQSLLIFREDSVIGIDETNEKIIMKAIDSDGRLIDLSDCEISYTYSTEGVLIANNNGVITPISDGTTDVTVTATYNGTSIASNTLTLDVIDPEAFSYIEASVSSDSLPTPGKTLQINVTPYNRVGGALEGVVPEYTYKSSDTEIATVSDEGLITAVAPGTVQITVTATTLGTTDEYSFNLPVSYSELITYDFEFDTVGESPNFTVTVPENHVKVSNTVSASGNNSIHINDTLLASMVNFRISDEKTSAIRHLEFNIYPITLTDGFNVRFNVNNAYTSYQHKFNVSLAEDGSVLWYNGSTWNEILPAGTVKLNKWNHVVLSTNVTTKTLTASVNGTVKTQTEACSTHGATAYTMGIELGSGSTAGRACEVYLDDIKMYKDDELVKEVHTLANLTADIADETVNVDDITRIITAITNKDGFAINGDDITVSYKSSNEKVATVGSDGTVTGIADGKCTITVTVTQGEISLSKSVEVKVIDLNVTSFDFEKDTVGEAPLGGSVYPDGNFIIVSDDKASEGTKSLYVNDTTASAMTCFRIPDPVQSATRYLEFDIFPVNMTDGILIRFFVNNDFISWQHKYNIGIMSDGSIKWYNGSGWNVLIPAGTVKAGEWNHITVSTDLSDKSLTISANGVEKSQLNATSSSGATAYTMGLEFSSGGTADKSCEFYLDNIRTFRDSKYLSSPEETLVGDVNSDGKVDRKDLSRLAQYFARWQVEVDMVAADTNGDGNVDRKDLSRLAQFFARWDVELGK